MTTLALGRRLWYSRGKEDKPMYETLILTPVGADESWMFFCADALASGVTPIELNLLTLMYEEIELYGGYELSL